MNRVLRVAFVALGILGIGYILVTVGYNIRLDEEQPTVAAEEQKMQVDSESLTVEIWHAVNAEREKLSVAPLRLDQNLISSATAKCEDMVKRDYWDHYAPDGSEPWHFFTEANYEFTKAGENLAIGYTDASETVMSWLNSEGHRDTMLATIYTDTGIAICDDGFDNTMIVQHFGAQ